MNASILPIAQLEPGIDTANTCIKGIVTLVWPYSSSRKAYSILLVEPDFRLRRNKGQVRITFRKASAKALARAGIASGDELEIQLDHCRFAEEAATVQTPGKSVGWELRFERRLHLRISGPDAEPRTIEVDAAADSPEPGSPRTPAPQTPIQKAFSPTSSIKSVSSWSTPAFLKKRTFDSTLAPSSYDIFGADETSSVEPSAKKLKIGRGSQQWRFVARSPSPDSVPGENTATSHDALQGMSIPGQLPVDPRPQSGEAESAMGASSQPSGLGSQDADASLNLGPPLSDSFGLDSSQIRNLGATSHEDLTAFWTDPTALVAPEASQQKPHIGHFGDDQPANLDDMQQGEALVFGPPLSGISTVSSAALPLAAGFPFAEQADPFEPLLETPQGINSQRMHDGAVQQVLASGPLTQIDVIPDASSVDAETSQRFEDYIIEEPNDITKQTSGSERIVDEVPEIDSTQNELEVFNAAEDAINAQANMYSRQRDAESSQARGTIQGQRQTSLIPAFDETIIESSSIDQRYEDHRGGEQAGGSHDLVSIAPPAGSARGIARNMGYSYLDFADANLLREFSRPDLQQQEAAAAITDPFHLAKGVTETETANTKGEDDNMHDPIESDIALKAAQTQRPADEMSDINSQGSLDEEGDLVEEEEEEDKEEGSSEHTSEDEIDDSDADISSEEHIDRQQSEPEPQIRTHSHSEVIDLTSDDDSVEPELESQQASKVEGQGEVQSQIASGMDMDDASQSGADADPTSRSGSNVDPYDDDRTSETPGNAQNDEQTHQIEAMPSRSGHDLLDAMAEDGPSEMKQTARSRSMEETSGRGSSDTEVTVSLDEEQTQVIQELTRYRYDDELSQQELSEASQNSEREQHQPPQTSINELSNEGSKQRDIAYGRIESSSMNETSSIAMDLSVSSDTRLPADDKHVQPRAQSSHAMLEGESDTFAQAHLSPRYVTSIEATPQEAPVLEKASVQPGEDLVVVDRNMAESEIKSIPRRTGETSPARQDSNATILRRDAAQRGVSGKIVDSPSPALRRSGRRTRESQSRNLDIPLSETSPVAIDPSSPRHVVTQFDGTSEGSNADDILPQTPRQSRPEDVEDTPEARLKAYVEKREEELQPRRSARRAVKTKKAAERDEVPVQEYFEDQQLDAKSSSVETPLAQTVLRQKKSKPSSPPATQYTSAQNQGKELTALVETKQDDEVSMQLLRESQMALEEAQSPPPLTKGARTKHAYLTPLSNLHQHFRQDIDVMGLVIGATKPQKAQTGPRDWHMTIYVTDASIQDAAQSLRTVQLFRPSKSALPQTATADDLIILHNFHCQTERRKPTLISTASSGWLVVDGAGNKKTSGPPIEYDDEELDLAEHLSQWWSRVADDKKMRLRTDFVRARDAAKEMARRKSGRRSMPKPGALAHELRDGTIYPYTDTAVLPEDVDPPIHELRDGSIYQDEV